jgi:hypothetical protein
MSITARPSITRAIDSIDYAAPANYRQGHHVIADPTAPQKGNPWLLTNRKPRACWDTWFVLSYLNARRVLPNFENTLANVGTSEPK